MSLVSKNNELKLEIKNTPNNNQNKTGRKESKQKKNTKFCFKKQIIIEQRNKKRELKLLWKT